MVGETKRVCTVSAGGTKYQIMVIDTREESGISIIFCKVFRCFFSAIPAIFSLKSSSTVCGQNQPHQTLPKIMVTKPMKRRKKSATPRMR
jgi:hypothetical protein